MSINFNEQAITVLNSRYLIKDRNGVVIETPEGMLHRVSKHIASAENKDKDKWDNIYYSLMENLYFLPNSPTLMNAGRANGQLSACFLINIEDDLAAILEAVKRAAVIHKTGGGTGLVFSHIRPNNSIVGTTTGVASGPVSFMKIFNTCTEVIKQGGVRRGANLGALNVSHPDILEFIDCKQQKGQFENFNMSVVIDDKFMNALKNNSDYTLNFKGEQYRTLPAQDIFSQINKNAHKSGDPGILFIDTMNKYNPTPFYGKFEGTNPCGEQMLLSWESCNLGSLNISKFVDNNKQIDYELLDSAIKIATRFLDNVITVNNFPNAKIQHKTLLTRKIGLGVMGWADALLMMGIRYDTDEALNLAEEIMKFISERSHAYARDLGKERGNCCDGRLKTRNASTTTIAPTGTLSILAGCSSGIEPIFAKNYTKTVLDGKKLDLTSAYADSKALITAHEISPERHVMMQAAFQKYTDNAVSKTINLPEKTTAREIGSIFMHAWTMGCKGITVFREGSRAGVLDKSPDGNGFEKDKGLSECENGRCSLI
jgi:ribonucleoside-diphosphate reductase alpha chain